MGVMFSFSNVFGKVLWSLIYPHRMALFSGGLSTKITPTSSSSTGLFTPAVLKGGESGSELWGEVRGELVSGVLWEGVAGWCIPSGEWDSGVVKVSPHESLNLCVIWCCFILPFVVNPLPQTSHLNGLSLVWLRMWISRAELHANTL